MIAQLKARIVSLQTTPKLVPVQSVQLEFNRTNEQTIHPVPSTSGGQGQQMNQKRSFWKSKVNPESEIKPDLEQEFSFAFDHRQNEPVQNEPTRQYVQYQQMPPTPPNFNTLNNAAYEDQTPFSAIFQIKPKEPSTFAGKMEEDVVSWLNQVNSFFNMIPQINDIQKCCYVGSCLRGAA